MRGSALAYQVAANRAPNGYKKRNQFKPKKAACSVTSNLPNFGIELIYFVFFFLIIEFLARHDNFPIDEILGAIGGQ
jgi:hypothetical protein